MPPIPVYTKSPITAGAKAAGVTPETAAAPDGSHDPGLDGNLEQSRYAPAGSTPTPTATHTVTHTLTATRTSSDGGPPPPQPGAVPHLPAATGTPGSTLPTPPRAGETYHHAGHPPAAPEPTAAARLPGAMAGTTSYPPPQMAVPAPTVPYAQRGTMPATSGSLDGYYHQRDDAGDNSYGGYGAYQGGGGNDSYYGRSDGTDGEGGEEGVWGSAVKWAHAAGKKLSDAETEVWRRINKQ